MEDPLIEEVDNPDEYLIKPIFIKNKKNGEVRILEYMEVIDKNKWEQSTISEYHSYQKIKQKKIQALRIDNFLDNAKILYEKKPYYYDNSNIWWLWEENRWKITDDIEMEIMLDSVLGFQGQTISSSIRKNHLQAMKWVGRQNKPKDAPLKWVQFKDKAFSIESGNIYEVTKDFFFTNPIPYDIGTSEETPIMDSLFDAWVGKENIALLYEIIAYCTYRDYPIHRIFCLVGSGSNGKSRFLALIRKFLGEGNFCSTELDCLIDSRFEGFKLYKKLGCIMGETNFGVMSKTSMLKKLSGQDSIGIEKKGKDPFDMENYAKLLISSNSLPSSLDTSDGFYRRFLIIKFPNQFSEGNDILETIPKIEYNNLCLKIKNLLPKLLNSGKFTNEGSIEKRKNDYIENSNPLSLFIKTNCKEGVELFSTYAEVYTRYSLYLLSKRMRKVTTREFREVLENEGFFIDKTTKIINGESKNGHFIIGLELKNDQSDGNAKNLTPFSIREKDIENRAFQSLQSQLMEKIEEQPSLPMEALEFDEKNIAFHKCEVEFCKETECCFDAAGVPYCRKHYDLMTLRTRRN
jgi:putative DNA primase/helicase